MRRRLLHPLSASYFQSQSVRHRISAPSVRAQTFTLLRVEMSRAVNGVAAVHPGRPSRSPPAMLGVKPVRAITQVSTSEPVVERSEFYLSVVAKRCDLERPLSTPPPHVVEQARAGGVRVPSPARCLHETPGPLDYRRLGPNRHRTALGAVQGDRTPSPLRDRSGVTHTSRTLPMAR